MSAAEGYGRGAMSRTPRSQLPDVAYHVTTRGVNGTWIFRYNRDRRCWLGLLALVVRQFGWRMHAFCLMGNHFHLVVECPRAELSDGMRLLNGRYAQWFNGKYRRHGHLFGARFGARVIESDEYLAAAIEYVLNNPVRARLCTAASDWRWSGSGSDGRGSRALHAVEQVERLVELGVRDDERRRRLDQPSAFSRRDDQHTAAPRLLPVAGPGPQQAGTAPPRLLEPLAGALHPAQKPRDLIENDETGCARERVPHVRVRVDVLRPEIPKIHEPRSKKQRRRQRKPT